MRMMLSILILLASTAIASAQSVPVEIWSYVTTTIVVTDNGVEVCRTAPDKACRFSLVVGAHHIEIAGPGGARLVGDVSVDGSVPLVDQLSDCDFTASGCPNFPGPKRVFGIGSWMLVP